jgi:hypothetical protein
VKRVLPLLGLLLWLTPVSATTHYISFSTGANTNNGLTKGTAWKTHPYMQAASGCTTSGSAPTYSHSAGDIAIFKQGDSWPNACFDMVVAAGGSIGTPDVYTFDPTWGTAGGTTGNKGQAVGTYQFTAGGTVINGTSTINRFIYESGLSYITYNGMELTGMTWTGSPSYGNAFGISANADDHIIVSNIWCHGWTHSGATLDVFHCVDGEQFSPYNVGSQVTGSVFDGTGATDSGEAVHNFQILDNNIVKNMSNGLLPGLNAIVHDNLIFNINTSFDAADHENCIEPLGLISGLTSTNYIYNNVWHDCTAVGILTQGNSPSNGIEKDYLWNNVAYIGATATPPIPMQFDSVSTSNSSSEVHAWNNTIFGGSGGVCMRTVSRGNGNFGVLDIQNNHCISGSGILTNSQTGNTFTNVDNLLMSLATATSQGYTSAQTYAYSPTLVSNATVGVGANLTSLASGATASLVNDTTYGGARSTNGRPAPAAAWDAGAYEFSGAAPSPPTNVTVIILQ